MKSNTKSLIRLVLLFCLLQMAFSNQVMAHQRDFSGDWKINVEKSDFEGIPTWAAWQFMSIVQQEDKLELTYTSIDQSGVATTSKSLLVIGGAPEKKDLTGGLSFSRSITPSNDKKNLIITTDYHRVTDADESNYTIILNMSLDNAGNLLNVIFKTDAYTLKLSYDRITKS